MENNKQVKIGWAEIDITPEMPVMVFGQLYERVSEYVKEPLSATAFVIEDGTQQVIMVSLDVALPPEMIIPAVKSKLKSIHGINPDKITVNATHTHNAYGFGFPELFPNKIVLPGDIQAQAPSSSNVMSPEEGNAFLTMKIVEVIISAWENRCPSGISNASDYAVVGFNRRPMFRGEGGQDESVMYGAASRKDFRKFEDTVDHSAEMIYTWNTAGSLTGVLINIPSPSQVYELHSFISSDYWYEVRDQLRKKLGDIYILPLCGAAGDQNPLDLVRISKTNERELELWNAQTGEVNRNIDMKKECSDIGRRICDAVIRGLEKANKSIKYNPIIKHNVKDIEFPIRLVKEDEALQARRKVEEYIKPFSSQNRMKSTDMVMMFEPCGIIHRWEQQQKSKSVQFSFHIIRICDTAIVTNPFELFVEYGLRIKARAKSPQTLVVQLSDASGGYLPTETAVKGGSYSSKPASTLCGPEAGDILCENLISEIECLFGD